jgi:hypothetical protein
MMSSRRRRRRRDDVGPFEAGRVVRDGAGAVLVDGVDDDEVIIVWVICGMAGCHFLEGLGKPEPRRQYVCM